MDNQPKDIRIISRVDARAAGLNWFFTGDPCKAGHIAQMRVRGGSCKECARLYSKARREADLDGARERTKASVQLHYQRNRGKVLEKKRAYYLANAEAVKVRMAAYRARKKAEKQAATQSI